MKIAPVIITRIYRKDRNDRVGFVTSTPTPVQSTSYLFHGYSIEHLSTCEFLNRFI